jgi:cell division protein FtsA
MFKSSKTCNFFYLGASKSALARVDLSNPSKPGLVFFKEVPSEGFHLGRISDLELASRQIRSLFQEAGLDHFPEIILVMSSPDLKGYTFASSIFYSSPRHTVGPEDLDEVIRQTRNVSMVPLKETIIQSIPQEYWVNDSRGIQNPLDLEAERLGVSLRIITLSSEIYRNLSKMFDRCEAEIKSIYPKALSASYCVLEEHEKKDGVLLIELGGYATDLVYYKDNVLRYSNSFPWGTDALTQNLIDRFHLKVDEARKIKEDFGTLLSGSSDEETLPITRDEHGLETLKRGELREVLIGNLDTFWKHLETEIQAVQILGRLPQLVLSGGGAKLEGLLETIEEKYSIRTRFGNPRPFGLELNGSASWDASFSSLWGAVRKQQELLKQDKVQKGSQNILARVTSQAREWLESYF